MAFGLCSLLAQLWTKRAQSHRTRREAARNTMASFAGDDYALERRKLRELQASVSRSTPSRPSVPRKKAPTPTSDGTAAAAAAAKRLRAALKVAGMRRAAELEVIGLLDALEAAHARCADEAVSKPDPAMLHQLVDMLETSAARSLMVGDSSFDIEMAHNAGMRSVAVSYGAQSRAQLLACAPLHCIDVFAELPLWLRAQRADWQVIGLRGCNGS